MMRRNLEIMVGLFVVLAATGLIFLAIAVSGVKDVLETKNVYRVDAYFDNVGGLKNRARVQIAGVTIGRVENIGLTDDTFEAKVTMLIQENFNDIPADSSASILTAGLIGDNYISIAPGAADAPLKEGSQIINTHSAVILEQLIGQFLYNQDN